MSSSSGLFIRKSHIPFVILLLYIQLPVEASLESSGKFGDISGSEPRKGLQSSDANRLDVGEYDARPETTDPSKVLAPGKYLLKYERLADGIKYGELTI